MRTNQIVFICLNLFSGNGGLEKFNKAFVKSLCSIATGIQVFSLYDKNEANEYYVSAHQYTAFKGAKLRFIGSSIFRACTKRQIIIGHLNLAVVGVLVKMLLPWKKVVIVVHGLEIWLPVSRLKKFLLYRADQIITVSSHTKHSLIKQFGLEENKINILHNTVDPYFPLPTSFEKPKFLVDRHVELNGKYVAVSVCRMKATEAYKGYDKVIQCIPDLLLEIPNLHYMIVGSWDEKEKKRIDDLIEQLNVKEYVTFTGFVKDEELTAYFQLGDVFVMPSKFEGFGIVYIEAMACGVPVIAGNKDGSVDALANGALGKLIDPDNLQEIASALLDSYKNRNSMPKGEALQEAVLKQFSFEVYQNRVRQLLL